MNNKLEITTRRLDLTARSIDLLGSLVDIAGSKNNLATVALEVGAWLGRERLNRFELQTCFEHARGLLVPNKQGEAFLNDVRTGISSHAVLPLLVQPSGALGRLLLNDPRLCWLVSTAACLLQYHNEQYTMDAILDLMVNTSVAQEREYLTQYRLGTHPLRIQLEPVVQKLVSSIWLNVVNSGSNDLSATTSNIPGLCTSGHYLRSDSFGLFMSAINQNYKKMMVLSDLVPSDLLLWLLHHFHGRIRVVLSGKIVHERDLGQNDREVEIRINIQCPTDDSCASKRQEKSGIALYTDVAGGYKEFLHGSINTKVGEKMDPCARVSLYSIATVYPTQGRLLRDTLRIQIKCTAQIIVRWMLERPVKPSFSDRLAFPVLVNGGLQTCETIGIIADLLARQPSMLNLQWGDVLGRSVVFANPSGTPLEENDEHSGNADAVYANDQAYQDHGEEESFGVGVEELFTPYPETILQYFPCLRDLLEVAKQSCQCTYCRATLSNLQISPQTTNTLKPGCLQWNAFADVMVLVAHAIADGFGAPDSSAMISISLDHYRTSDILRRLCVGEEISWEQWMGIAAQVFLGCPNVLQAPYDPSNTSSHPAPYTRKPILVDTDNFDTTTIAVQYGSLAVVAPWLDLSRRIQTHGCFAFHIVHGRLCIRADTSTEQRFQVVEDEFAVIKTQKIEDFTPHDTHLDTAVLRPGQTWTPSLDRHSIETDVMLLSAEGNSFKLLQRVRSDTCSRLIDPSKAMLTIARNPILCSCPHTIDNQFKAVKITKGSLSYHIAPCSFDQILGTWLPGDQKFGKSVSCAQVHSKANRPKLTIYSERTANATVFISDQLDSYAKFNVALALSPDKAFAINQSSACVRCSVDQTIELKTNDQFDRFVSARTPCNRWIITTTKHLREIPMHYLPPPKNPFKFINEGITV